MIKPKKIALIGCGVAVFLVLFALLIIPNLSHPLEHVPVDWGWVGVLFIFLNGFFLSTVLEPTRIGLGERFLLSVGLGLGITFVVMILLGVFWEFSLLSVVLSQLTLLIVLSVAAILRGFRLKFNSFLSVTNEPSRFSKRHIFPLILLITLSVVVFAASYNALAFPASEWDSLTYGVNYAKIIFQHGKIPLIAGPSIGLEMSASYPPGVQLTAVSLYVLAGNPNDFYYRLLPPIFGLATMLATYKLAVLLNKNKTYAIYAVSALSAVPIFWEMFIAESYLMALTLMLILAAYFFFKAYSLKHSDAKKYELMGALFCGFAALTSYVGLLSLGVLFLYVLMKRASLKRFSGLAATSLIVLLPWYLRNTTLLGNPVYPFFGFGKYLDPLLRSSTVLHFQNFQNLAFYGFTSTLCKIGAIALVFLIAYVAFAKRKWFFAILPLYLLFICCVIMGFHVAFPRYLLIAMPLLAVAFSAILKVIARNQKATVVTSAVFMLAIVFSSALMLPYISTYKPASKIGEDKTQYLSRLFEEGDAWQWINTNTPANASIATFDIKEYYINRTVFHLDGVEAAPLYNMTTIQESMNFLQKNGVEYVLSVPWASPTDNRLPPAYTWCPLTDYLGDSNYLPPVFVGIHGTTVYHVGSLESAGQAFEEKSMVQPLRNSAVDFQIANDSNVYLESFYLPIPVDYRGGNLTVQINNSKRVDGELYSGLIPQNKIEDPHEQYELVKNWTGQGGVSSTPQNSSFMWQIDKAGYFTFRVINPEKTTLGTFSISFDLSVNSTKTSMLQKGSSK